jgi:Carboxypeptidase regulatory-like domain
MVRKLGLLVAVMAVAFSVPAAASQGTITGKVKSAAGTPQMGAMVEAISLSTSKTATVFTDNTGYYAFYDLIPGSYDVKVSAASFLPTLREKVSLRSGATLVVNLTLNTLTDAIRLLPTKQGTQEDDDWRWTLRSAANRPILRMKNGQPVVVANGKGDQPVKASVAFVAGTDSDAFGGSNELSTRFNVERSMFQTGLLSLKGDVGYGTGANDTVLRTTYSHKLSDGSTPEVSLTMRRFALSPTEAMRDSALEALTLTTADNLLLGDFVELHVGSEYQSVQYMGRVNAIKPFGSVDVHLSPDMLVEYQYTTSMPNMRRLKGFDTAPADMTEAGPRMTMSNSQAVMERARHQEISASRRIGKNAVQVAFFDDHVRNAALTGVGDVSDGGVDILPDFYSGTFAYNGGTLDATGARFVYSRQLPDGLTATMNYAFGGVLDLGKNDLRLADVRSGVVSDRRHSVALKLAGTLPHSKTQWITSYKWSNGASLTPVDLFNAGPGQADSFLNIFIRQPVPGTKFMPGKLEALVDIRNLLAQGYRPVLAGDGQTVYLVESARSVRGGVAFVF